MKPVTSTDSPVLSTGNLHDTSYAQFLGAFSAGFSERNCRRPIFETDAKDLWDLYLSEFPEGPERQHVNCIACKRFITQYGGLAYVNDDGTLESAVWRDNSPGFRAMEAAVKRARVTGFWVSSVSVLGKPTTGVWRHLAINLPDWLVWKKDAQDAHELMAAKREAHAMVSRALADYPVSVLDPALSLLLGGTLARSEKVLGAARWMRELAGEVAARTGSARSNLIWRAVAKAPEGFVHLRSGMLGWLLDTIKDGTPADVIASLWSSRMHPLQYQRPQAAPSAGAIEAAEKLVREMGIAPSLERRFATMDDVPSNQILWAPRQSEETKSEGVFGHLKQPKVSKLFASALKPAPITWARFERTVLPTAERMEVRVGNVLGVSPHFTILTTAVHPSSPPILQWDLSEARNPCSWYSWLPGSTERQHGLRSGEFHPVSAIVDLPCHWSTSRPSHLPRRFLFIIPNARETENPGLSLFPEVLKSELHSIRSVIEAHSKDAKMAGLETGKHVVGLTVPGPAIVRVWSAGNVATDYMIDRFD